MIDVMIIGGGGHAIAVFDVLDAHPNFNPIGFVDKGANATLSKFLPYLGNDDDLKYLVQKTPVAVMGLGQIKTPQIRIHLGTMLQNLDAHLPAVISINATVSRHATVDAGSTVLDQVSINADCRIGKFNIINSGATIIHSAITEDYVHIAPKAIVLGNAKIGHGSFIGAGAVIREGITIGANCIIGAGVFVRRDVDDGSVVSS